MFFCLIGCLEGELYDLREVLYDLQREDAIEIKPFSHCARQYFNGVTHLFLK